MELGTAEPVETAGIDDATSAAPDAVRLKCATCGSGMKVPREKLEGKTEFKVRCPNPSCGVVMTLRKKPTAAQIAAEETEHTNE